MNIIKKLANRVFLFFKRLFTKTVTDKDQDEPPDDFYPFF